MVSLRRNIPSLSALVAFEAAARLGGFTRAANELSVTQAAISRQIRALETDLDVKLFVRSHRRVVLTDAGQALSEAVGNAFQTISETIDDLRAPRQPNSITISTTLSFSHFWLLPRLAAFRAKHPDVHIRLLSQDEPVALGNGDVDVAFRYGVAPFSDGTSLDSLSERIVPVASPDLADEMGYQFAPEKTPVTLPLIEGQDETLRWMSWGSWCARVGLPSLPRQRTLVFNHYSDAVYAATGGQGVLLGWARLLEEPLFDGRLVELGENAYIPDERHHLVVAEDSAKKPSVECFCAWTSEYFSVANAGVSAEPTTPAPAG